MSRAIYKDADGRQRDLRRHRIKCPNSGRAIPATGQNGHPMQALPVYVAAGKPFADERTGTSTAYVRGSPASLLLRVLGPGAFELWRPWLFL